MSRLPNIRFSKERDGDLIEWVETISQLPNGLKGEAVKDVLRMGLSRQSKMPSQAPKVEPRTTNTRQTARLAQLDISTLIEALRNEFLSDIRTIVDASINQSLGGITIGKEQTPPPENNKEAEDILDSFADLMLE